MWCEQAFGVQTTIIGLVLRLQSGLLEKRISVVG